jgi:hypothetical protein
LARLCHSAGSLTVYNDRDPEAFFDKNQAVVVVLDHLVQHKV